MTIVIYTIEYFHRKVKDEIENWPNAVLAHYLRLIELLMEFGPNLGMPHSKALGKGLFELRAHGEEGIGRAFYCFICGRRIVILHSFIKKTRSTPKQQLMIARRRLKEVKNG
jgi:phage-related protein